jgi:hypothetical protein
MHLTINRQIESIINAAEQVRTHIEAKYPHISKDASLYMLKQIDVKR